MIGATPATALTTPTIVSTASGATSIGSVIFDTVNLNNGANPTGTLAFNLFGPNDASCSGAPLFSPTTAVSGNGFYQSASFTTSQAGTYRWVVSYSGDGSNNPAGPTSCTDPNESVIVSKFLAVIATVASPSVPVGGPIHDTATLGGFRPTGTITFRLSGPGDPFCNGAPVFTTTAPVTAGNGSYPSPSFTPTVAGTYRWQAMYGGDANNAPAPISACLIEVESVVVTGGVVTPTISTTASPSVAVGGAVTDTATLSGGNSPTGTITFKLFGPNNTTCTGAPTFTSTSSVTGNGATSGVFTVAAVGLYRWAASYSGDGGNSAVSSACGATNEDVTVTKANTTIVTSASAPAMVGGTIGDTAILSGGFAPTGTITFDLFGPDNAGCTGSPAFTSTRAVNGSGSYASPLFTTLAAGTYRWVATYSGDANSNPAGPTACNDAAEAVVVSTAPTTTTTSSTTTTTSTTVPPTTTTSTTTTSTTSTTTSSTTTTSTSTTIPGTTTTSTSTTIPGTTTTSTSTTVPGTTTTTVPGTTTTIPGTTTTSTIPGTTTTIPGTTSTTATTVPSTTTTTTGSTTTTSSTTTTLPPPTTTTSTTADAGSGPTVQARPSVVPAGGTTVVSGSGFPGGSQLRVTLFSDPVLLGTTTANSLGNYQLTVTIPAATSPGTHTLVVSTTSTAVQAQTTLTVTAPTSATTATSTTLPAALGLTGANVRGTSAAALSLMIIGLATLALTRRRRQPLG